MPAGRTGPQRPTPIPPWKFVAWIPLSENLNRCYLAFTSLQRSRLVWRRATALRAQLEVKKFGNGLFRFAALLQPLEIPQNRQRILWKSLDETGGNLEMFEKTLEVGRRASSGARFAVHEAQRGLAKP